MQWHQLVLQKQRLCDWVGQGPRNGQPCLQLTESSSLQQTPLEHKMWLDLSFTWTNVSRPVKTAFYRLHQACQLDLILLWSCLCDAHLQIKLLQCASYFGKIRQSRMWLLRLLTGSPWSAHITWTSKLSLVSCQLPVQIQNADFNLSSCKQSGAFIPAVLPLSVWTPPSPP